MQAITIAIGTKGIEYFCEKLIAGNALNTLQKLKPDDRTITVPDFHWSQFGSVTEIYNFHLYLTDGSLTGFNPAYADVKQGNDRDGNQFTLRLKASDFTAKYSWREKYDLVSTSFSGPQDELFAYSATVNKLAVALDTSLLKSGSTYRLQVNTASSDADVARSIPERSALNDEARDGCYSSKVSDATASSIASIDFATPIQQLFQGALGTIEDSGKLTDKIWFRYGLGDRVLEFPYKDGTTTREGITLGVTGVAVYDGTPYSGANPPSLPIPAVPGDDRHLNVYVSDWAVNGLYWAYFSAGLLKSTIRPNDLSDPALLRCATYATTIKSFARYGRRTMTATVTAKAAPVAAFQTVYLFDDTGLAALEKKLPRDLYTLIKDGFAGSVYVDKATLEDALTTTDVPSAEFENIESGVQAKCLVATQTMTFQLDIQADDTPNVIFEVQRTDVMTDLKLGARGNAQVLSFWFRNAGNKATFISTTVPGFDSTDFGSHIWPWVGEPSYAQVMKGLGETGVPLPIMSGFQFLFDEATVSVQDGFIAIGAKVEFKPARLPPALARLVYEVKPAEPGRPAVPVCLAVDPA